MIPWGCDFTFQNSLYEYNMLERIINYVNANNDVNILLTEANLAAQETTFAFEQEAVTIVNVKESLGLSTNGVLAYLTNGLLADVDTLRVTTHEPAKMSRSQELSSVPTLSF